MIRMLLLLLVVFVSVLSTFAQQAEILGNCFYDNTNSRIVIRLAIRNKTNSSADMEFVGMRFGLQFNQSAVTYAGYKSYLINGWNLGLDDPSNLAFIGADTGPSPAVETGSPVSRVANITTGGQKTMQIRHINRSTSLCGNAVIIPSAQYKLMVDVYFTLVNNNPAYYKLNTPNYGFDSPEFIAQFLTKNNGGHTGNLIDAYKEIAVVIVRQGNEANPYQPFDMSGCSNGSVNPVTVSGDDITFISPVNGVLSSKVQYFSATEDVNNILLNWKVQNNELVDHYEIERSSLPDNGYVSIGTLKSLQGVSTAAYSFKDAVFNSVVYYYRIKSIGYDGQENYSTIISVRKNRISNVLKLGPSPVFDKLLVQLPAERGYFTCRIFSSDGKLMLQNKIRGTVAEISVASFQRGSYFAEVIHDETGKRFTGRFSRQ